MYIVYGFNYNILYYYYINYQYDYVRLMMWIDTTLSEYYATKCSRILGTTYIQH